MNPRLALAPLALALALPAPSAFARADDTVAQLRAQDIRLARVAEQLQAGNVAMCPARMPLTGMILHSRDQYTAPPAQWFAAGEVAVAAVVPGSPAERAGIRAGDALVAIAGEDLAALEPADGHPLRDAVLERIAAVGAATLNLRLRRDAEEREVELAPPAGCRILAEILTSNEIRAISDGRVLQVSYGLAARLSEEELAVVAAHELAHAILEHRRRLAGAGVRKGLLGEFGRDRRLSRQAEIEADRLAVHLLANAGYDPSLAIGFWTSEAGKMVDRGLLRSRVYPSREQRAEIARQEIAAHLSPPPPVSWPGHLLALREVPFPVD